MLERGVNTQQKAATCLCVRKEKLGDMSQIAEVAHRCNGREIPLRTTRDLSGRCHCLHSSNEGDGVELDFCTDTGGSNDL